MSPFLINAGLYGILIPGGVAALCVVAARPWQRDPTGFLLPILACLALFAGYAAGHRGLTGTLEFSPIDISNWLPHMAAVAALVGIGHAFLGERLLGRTVLTALGAILVMWLVLRPQLDFRFTGMTGVWVVLGSGLAMTGYLLAIERAVTGESARVGAVLTLVIAGVAPAMVALSGSLLLGQLGGAAAAAVGALAVIAFIFKNPALLRATLAFVSLSTGALIALAYLYASMRYQVVLALGLAPAAVLVTRVLMERFGSDGEESRIARFGWIARIAVLLAFAGVAGLFASMEETESTDDGEYDYGYGYE